MKKHFSTILVILIFLSGLTLFLYPTVSNLWNEHINSNLIKNYKEELSDIPKADQKKFLEDARTYNENMYDKKKLAALGLSYENVLNVRGDGIMGYIEIPKIKVSLVIYHTVSDSLLQDAVGHVEETSLPVGGPSTHAVLAGHRGLPSAKLLTNIDHLNLGDFFNIHVLDEVLKYRIDDISVVKPSEVSKLKVETGKDYVTLVTCTPYGINTHRLLVRGIRVPDNEIAYDGDMLAVSNDLLHINPIYLIPVCLILLVLAVWIGRRIYQFIRKRKVGLKKSEHDDAETE